MEREGEGIDEGERGNQDGPPATGIRSLFGIPVVYRQPRARYCCVLSDSRLILSVFISVGICGWKRDPYRS